MGVADSGVSDLESQYLIRINTDIADASQLTAALQALAPERADNAKVSSEQGLELIAAAASEAQIPAAPHELAASAFASLPKRERSRRKVAATSNAATANDDGS